jgi:hypothetical protein
MRKLLLPFLLLFVGCNLIGYDSGWVDGDGKVDFREKLTKADIAYIGSLSIFNIYDEVFTGDELTSKYGVPYSLRQQTNLIVRLEITNGIKTIYRAKFRGDSYWELWIIPIPKD